MSLSIDTRRICAVYALDQWHKVKVNSFCTDAYELMEIEEDCPFGNEWDNRNPSDFKRDKKSGEFHPREPHTKYFQMSALYDEVEYNCTTFDNSPRTRFLTPTPSTGVTFIDPDSDESVYFSIVDIKAFRCVSREEAIKRDPDLKPIKR